MSEVVGSWLKVKLLPLAVYWGDVLAEAGDS
jgi:hypothetical protein